DPVYKKKLDAQGQLQQATSTVDQLELQAVFWSEGDALPFPLCISKRPAPDIPPWENLSVARGNVVPCDHGRTVDEKLDLPVPRGNRAGGVATRLKQGPLTFQAFPLGQDRHGLAVSPRDAVPAVELRLQFPPNENEPWFPVPHLLDSTALDKHFVVDVDAAGRAEIRFGDNEYGRLPAGTDKVVACYRIGNGPAGNLGREALVHAAGPIVLPITKVRQPLSAVGGTAAETIEEVRQLAPRAFQSETFRAVTEEDYEAAALKLPAVLAAKATFRWTGSWHTVFVAAHPRNPADLITLPGGRTRLSDDLARKLRAHLTRYKLAGYDLEVLTARYVPLEIALRICVAPGHFRGDALEGVRRALSNRAFHRGEFGFFHPSRFAFGQPVYISRLYEVVEKVPGVESAVITVFKRYWELAGDELANGVIPLGEGEIARLDNDPNFAENGVLRVTAVGGL
ncbi:MAG TPA: putative baseplate assembly protein, partial [Thermoanaerobaculia bacterium]|nr:putative baseplate assembly protein [Thermoanaerobaculia bacterium]